MNQETNHMTIRSLAHRTRFVLAPAGAGVLILGTVILTPTTASAHTPEVTADCRGVTLNLTNYQVKPATTKQVVDVAEHQELVKEAWTETIVDSPEIPAIPAVPAQDAVYGAAPVITPAVPAQAAVPAVTHVEYQFVQKITGKVRWETNPNWNAGVNGKGWSKTGACRTVVDVPGKPAVPGKDAVYGEPPLITPAVPEQPAMPAVPAVTHTVEHDAEYVTVPATYKDEVVPGDDEPNTVSITTGSAHEDHTFGAEHHGTVAFEDSSITNTYTVDVVAYDDPDGSNGWTKQFTGTVQPCEATTPPVTTPPSSEPSESTPTPSTPEQPQPTNTPTPPTDEPTTPGTPSEQPTAPSPTVGTSQPSSSPVAPVPSSSTTPPVVPVAADTSKGQLAFTGSPLTMGTQIGLIAAAVLVVGFGALLLTLRTMRRRKDDRG